MMFSSLDWFDAGNTLRGEEKLREGARDVVVIIHSLSAMKVTHRQGIEHECPP